MSDTDQVTSRHRLQLEEKIRDGHVTGSLLTGILANLGAIQTFITSESNIGFIPPSYDPKQVRELVLCDDMASYIIDAKDGLSEVLRIDRSIFAAEFHQTIIGSLQTKGLRYGFFVNDGRSDGHFSLYQGGMRNRHWDFPNYQIEKAVWYDGQLYTLAADRAVGQMIIFCGNEQIRRHEEIECNHFHVDKHGLSYLYQAGGEWFLTNASLENLSQINTVRLLGKPEVITYNNGWWAYWFGENIEIAKANEITMTNLAGKTETIPVILLVHLEIFVCDGQASIFYTNRAGSNSNVFRIYFDGNFLALHAGEIIQFAPSDEYGYLAVVRHNRKDHLCGGDQRLGGPFDEILFPCSHGRKISYAGRTGKRWQIILDGETICRADQVFDLRIEEGPVFGARLVALIRRGRQLIKFTRLLGT
ncbi:hypothetical protein HY523_00405 [Candidatus Berkelbacteria bacterium]|nr:hypothetical protein [Candidatus Berkelbacteria bacterium]